MTQIRTPQSFATPTPNRWAQSATTPEQAVRQLQGPRSVSVLFLMLLNRCVFRSQPFFLSRHLCAAPVPFFHACTGLGCSHDWSVYECVIQHSKEKENMGGAT